MQQLLQRRAQPPNRAMWRRESGRSRRPKLDSLSPDTLLTMAREWLAVSPRIFNVSSRHVVAVLESAAQRGHEEAQWLLRTLSAHGPLPDRAVDGMDFKRWAVAVFSSEDSPRALYYRARALYIGDAQGLETMCASAESGFAPALVEMGTLFGGREWLQRAAESDPVGAFELARLNDGKVELEVLRAAAAMGDTGCMLYMVANGCVGSVETATLRARYILLTGDRQAFAEELNSVLPQSPEAYAIGRELEGYEQLWQTGWLIRPQDEVFVRTYVQAMHLARQAALQGLVGLRPMLGRDVAVSIARLVYASRSDVDAWLL